MDLRHIARPLSAKSILAACGPLEWDWDGKRMRVKIAGKPAVKLGPAYPADAAGKVGK